MKPLALLANDDGHASRGIRALREALLSAGFEVIIAAPETEQSASSHALTLHRPLRLRNVEPGVFAVDGTPADCVYVALHAADRVLPRTPDVVVSGLNHGLNLGQDVFYSGTVAAAREGALRGIPALATSAHPRADVEVASEACARVARALVGAGGGARRAPLLNLNFPRGYVRGAAIRPARLGARIYDELVDFRTDPRGREYFWLGGPGVRHEPEPGTDTEAYDAGVASITALVLDLTATGFDDLMARAAGAATE